MKFKKILRIFKKIFIKFKINYNNLRFFRKFDNILLILNVKFKRIMIYKRYSCILRKNKRNFKNFIENFENFENFKEILKKILEV